MGKKKRGCVNKREKRSVSEGGRETRKLDQCEGQSSLTKHTWVNYFTQNPRCVYVYEEDWPLTDGIVN